jgi:hypothetical protein
MGRHSKPRNIHPLLPKAYGSEVREVFGKPIRTASIIYVPLPFKLGLVKYPLSWTKLRGGAYGLTGLSVRSRYWALMDWADHADFDDRGDYILKNIRTSPNGKVRVK